MVEWCPDCQEETDHVVNINRSYGIKIRQCKTCGKKTIEMVLMR